MIVVNCVSLSNMNLRSLKSNYNDGNWHTKKQFENISFDKNFRSLALIINQGISIYGQTISKHLVEDDTIILLKKVYF